MNIQVCTDINYKKPDCFTQDKLIEYAVDSTSNLAQYTPSYNSTVDVGFCL